MAKTFSKEDVASHTKDNTPWIIIDEDVYDVSTFQDEHPGKFHIPSVRLASWRCTCAAQNHMDHMDASHANKMEK